MSVLRKIALILVATVGWNAGAWAASGYLSSIGLLRTSMTAFTNVVVGGYYSPGDKGGGTFVGIQTGYPPSCVDNGGTVIYNITSSTCYYRLSSNYGPKEFGAKGLSEGVSDGSDYTPIKNWLAAIQPHIGDVDTYYISNQLACNNETIQGPSNVDGAAGTAPLFVLRAISSGFNGQELIDAQTHCRLSGVVVDGNRVTTSVLVDNTQGVNGARVEIDGASALLNGNPNNLFCNKNQNVKDAGLMLKDSMSINSMYDNIVIECPNVRLVGDIIYDAGIDSNGNINSACETSDSNNSFVTCNGVTATGFDLTIADGADWGNVGNAVYLDGVYQVSIVGMDFNSNGRSLAGAGDGYGAAIFLDGASQTHNLTVSICGNHFRGSAQSNTDATHGGHIYFDGPSSDVSFCGNTYTVDTPNNPPNCANGSGNPTCPNYVYDSSGSAATLNPAAFYENPPLQYAPISSDQTIYSPNALTTVKPWQVVPTSGQARAARRAGPRLNFPSQNQPSGYTGVW